MVVSNFPCANDTAEMALYVSPAPTLVATAAQGTICYGQQDTLNATGGTTYLWGPNGETDSTIYVSPLVTTTYYIDASNVYGCTSSDSITVTVIPPGIPAAGNDQLLCSLDNSRRWNIFTGCKCTGCWIFTGNKRYHFRFGNDLFNYYRSVSEFAGYCYTYNCASVISRSGK